MIRAPERPRVPSQIAMREKGSGRPTKKERRELDRLRGYDPHEHCDPLRRGRGWAARGGYARSRRLRGDRTRGTSRMSLLVWVEPLGTAYVIRSSFSSYAVSNSKSALPSRGLWCLQ